MDQPVGLACLEGAIIHQGLDVTLQVFDGLLWCWGELFPLERDVEVIGALADKADFEIVALGRQKHGDLIEGLDNNIGRKS